MEAYGLYDPRLEHDSCGIGFVAKINGEKSRNIVVSALQILDRLSHRAACGSDPLTGDGAGILLQLPHRFFKSQGLALGFDIPRRRRYAVGLVFLPQDTKERKQCEQVVEAVVAAEGQSVIGWRDVPVDNSHIGPVAKSVAPVIRQIYIRRHRLAPSAFERKLFVIRKLAENKIRDSAFDTHRRFHIASLSAETIVYKGLLLPGRLAAFYPDLQDPEMVSAIGVVHSRFSTNTHPTWELAQPFRMMCHNGEINTVQSNRNWMNARRSLLQSAHFGGPMDRLHPFLVEGSSDSAQFDATLELLHLGGLGLARSIMMMIPEAWENDEGMDPERRAFYQYSSALLEPWDGPAAIAFTDGQRVGATLDRNGLRPARYVTTTDGVVILASESGVLDVPANRIKESGRLRPGRMLLVDTEEGQVVTDSEIKQEVTHRWPYKKWLAKNVYDVDRETGAYTGYNIPPFPDVSPPPRFVGPELAKTQRGFGYSDEDIRFLFGPMAETAKEPIGSMGNDAPLACLSDKSPPFSRYFHQLFAQVTNPAIDPIRESLVMSLETTIGPEGNTFEETPEQCHRLRMKGPVLDNEKLAKVAAIQEGVFEAIKIPILWPVDQGKDGMAVTLNNICRKAVALIDDGYNVLVLTDRGVDEKMAAIPALLAASAVNQHLVKEGVRLHTGLVVETGDVREVHDVATLIGFGASAVNPYVAIDTVMELAATGELATVTDPEEAKTNYIKALHKGLRKVMSKMGISTIQSYTGSQLFECVGLSKDAIDTHFGGAISRLSGLSLADLAEEALQRHARRPGPVFGSAAGLPIAGDYQWRRKGETHVWNPSTISALQHAARTNCQSSFDKFCQLVDDNKDGVVSLRGLLGFTESQAISIDLVEPASEICKRFVTGAMSFGSLSAEAHETLAIAMNRIGGRSNSGEGGEETRRYVLDPNGDSRKSAIKQIASARFGVTAEYLVNALDLQIKVSQGAKPGEGGQLPGHKVDERIAKVRYSTPGVTLISPPPHHDIYSIEDLAQLIYDLQTINPDSRVSVKLVSEAGVGTIAAGVAKAHAGAIVIAGASGGTGASPLSSIKRAGLPWELGIAETQQVLVHNDLRGRVRLQVDGGIRTPRDMAIATLLGAEEWGVATAALVVEGCIMLRKCHLNTCSVGIATQDASLRKNFTGDAAHVVAYFLFLAEGMRTIMAKLGFRTVDEMVGRVDKLTTQQPLQGKVSKLDLDAILCQPKAPKDAPRKFVKAMPWDRTTHFDTQWVTPLRTAMASGGRLEVVDTVRNTDRSVGTMLSGIVAREYGSAGLADNTVHYELTGVAGQSLGAFLSKGLTIRVTGAGNDYVGKGLSGGRVIVRPFDNMSVLPEKNVIIGNVALYGATGGELYVAGSAGERFCVRNSGARAVVEGMGDHGCEYMTGGIVVCLGKVGRNFAAGMSGGVAFVFDRNKKLRDRCNGELVEIESLSKDSDAWMLQSLLADHVRYTGSAIAKRILDYWEDLASDFLVVIPTQYKAIVEGRRRRRTTRPPIGAMGATGWEGLGS